MDNSLQGFLAPQATEQIGGIKAEPRSRATESPEISEVEIEEHDVAVDREEAGTSGRRAGKDGALPRWHRSGLAAKVPLCVEYWS